MTGNTDTMNAPQDKNIGWRVTFAGLGINLALGILYTWSVISKGIPKEWNWNEADKSWPYAIACLVFSLTMVGSGRMQDKIGPRIVATIGGVLVGVGMIITSFTTELSYYILGFGIFAGVGIGFGYASTTPPAVKWFPASKTGLIAGLVVAGFGLASVYAAPLTNHLIITYGMQKAILILGIAFTIIVVALAQLLRAPHKVLSFTKNLGPADTFVKKSTPADYTAGQMMSTHQFYLLWFMFACGAGAGLMVIAKLAAIAKIQAGISIGFVLVAMLAIGNGGGRILAGFISDKIGRQKTLLIFFLMQAFMVLLLSQTVSGSALANVFVMCLTSALIGANYGANLSLFPSITKDYYGLKNFGMNYGLVFTSWGVGGFMLSMLAGKLYDKYHTFAIAYYGAAGLLIIAAICTLITKPPKPLTAPAAAA